MAVVNSLQRCLADNPHVKRVVVHICRNPATGVWAMMQALCAMQNRKETQRSVLGILAPKTWDEAALEPLVESGMPFVFERVPFHSATVAYLAFILSNPVRRWIGEIRKAAPQAEIVLHFHSAWMTGGFFPLPVDKRVGVVATFHGIADDHRLTSIWWLRTAHRFLAKRLWRANAILTAVSCKTAVMAETILGVPGECFTVVPNGLPVKRLIPVQRDPHRLVVGHVGQMHPGKGWRLLLQAVDCLRERGLPVYLILAGGGMDGELAREAAKERTEYVEYLGYVANAGETVIPKLDVLVLASWTEGMPMGIIEAFSAGVVVVATPVGGIPEMVEDGVNGLLIGRSTDSICAALEKLIANPAILNDLRDGGRRTFAQKYDITKVAEQYDRVYERALENSRGEDRQI